MSVLLRHQMLLGLISTLVFFANLGGYALFDEDEPKNAVCGREMFERGDWIVPTFNASLRTDKPILIYWWMHVSFWLFGVSEFSARLGSAVLASGTVLLTYHMGRQLYSPAIGFLAGIILATSLLFSAIGRAVTPDATLIFCVTLAFAAYVHAIILRRGGHFGGSTVTSESSPSWMDFAPATPWIAIPIYVAMGLAVLAKGPVGALLPCSIIGAFLLTQMRVDRLVSNPRNWWLEGVKHYGNPRHFVQVASAMHLVSGCMIILIVACPWYATVGLATQGEWLRGFLGNHNLDRFLNVKESHRGPFFYYFVTSFIGCFPWSGFLPLSIWRLRRGVENDAWSASNRFLACWIGVWLLFFSLASTKLPNYVLPIFPAMALVMARYLNDWKENSASMNATTFLNCCRIYGATGLMAVAGIFATGSYVLPGEEWLAVIGAVPLAGASLAYAATVRGERLRAIQILSVTAVVLAVFVVGVAPSRLRTFQEIPSLAEAARRISGNEHPEIAFVDGFSPNLVFYARHPVVSLNPSDVEGFVDAHPDGFLITRSDRMDKILSEMRLVELSRCHRLLRPYDLVLLGRRIEVVQSEEIQRK